MRVPTQKRLLGISWTELPGDSLDHSTVPPTQLQPEESWADLGVEIDGAWSGPYRNPVFSPTHGTTGRPLPISGSLRYTAKLKTGVGANRSPILLSTPVLDDVTLFFECGGPKYLGWVSP